MNIVDIKLDDLKPYENNPRNNEEAVEPVVNFDLADNKVGEIATWDFNLQFFFLMINFL